MSRDTTHDPGLASWVESANAPQSDFPIQNLPFGRFRRAASGEDWRIGVAIGDQVLDCLQMPVLPGLTRDPWLAPLAAGDLNTFMALPAAQRGEFRRALSLALREGSAHRASLARCLVPQSDIELSLPCRIGDYTDFYVGIHHATAVGKLFRPDNPLLPNYKWVPIGYHGRASTIQASGTDFRRPMGQLKAADAAMPVLAPSARLDFELEVGIFIGRPNAQGEPIAIDAAEDHVFGLALFNDWSARDLQAWEYQPLGPFLSKNFASTVSPWIVTLEALAPFRREWSRAAGEPQPLPYLDGAANRERGAFDIELEVWLQTAAMKQAGHAGDRIATSNFAAAAYWTVAQLVAHHTVNGCSLASGDLFGSGTLSGARPEQAGSLLERTLGGKQPLRLSNGEQRAFLQDGDTVALRGYCQREGLRRIGFGECRATVLPAPDRLSPGARVQ